MRREQRVQTVFIVCDVYVSVLVSNTSTIG
jgi:hypothetical protein